MTAFCKKLVTVLGVSWIVLHPGGAHGQLIFGPPVNAGPGVNSTSSDAYVAITSNGLTMFFGSDRPDSPGHGYYDIYKASRSSVQEPFSSAERLPPPIYTYGSGEHEVELSSDDLELYFSDRWVTELRPPRPGGSGSGDNWVAARESIADDFAAVSNLGAPINSEYYEGGPSLSRDGLSLFFVSKRPGGRGGSDLWVAAREGVDQPWMTPTNLGQALNTPLNEVLPKLSPDGNSLIFTRHPTAAIWLTGRESTESPWKDAVLLPPHINSNSSRDIAGSFSPDGSQFYFASDRSGGIGGWDIWQTSVEDVRDVSTVEVPITGGAYVQDFDEALGVDGQDTTVLLPPGWIGASNELVGVNFVSQEFPGNGKRVQASGNGDVFNAGLDGDADRSLATGVSRQGTGNELQFLATATGGEATQLRVAFDLEAWGASSLSSSAPEGEAAFHVLAELDTGNGFQELLDLGAVTTGPFLQVPDDRLINGNNNPFRTQYDSGWVNDVIIPEDAMLRLRWITVMNEKTAGWTFGLDNVRLELSDTQAGPMLQPGDADQDLDFDQFDLIQVQQAAKYLTGQEATWGEGDWDGAPGGEPGNPPLGNGLFDQFDVIAALGANTYLTGPYAAVQQNGQTGDGQTSVVYNAGTGEIAVDAPAGVELTSINIDSASGIFTGVAAENLGGSFDNDADSNIFKATFGGSFGSVTFGPVARAGLSEQFVLGDLSVVGSLAGGGDLGAVDLVYVPEPSTIGMLVFGMLFGLRRFRRLVHTGKPLQHTRQWEHESVYAVGYRSLG